MSLSLGTPLAPDYLLCADVKYLYHCMRAGPGVFQDDQNSEVSKDSDCLRNRVVEQGFATIAG